MSQESSPEMLTFSPPAGVNGTTHCHRPSCSERQLTFPTVPPSAFSLNMTDSHSSASAVDMPLSPHPANKRTQTAISKDAPVPIPAMRPAAIGDSAQETASPDHFCQAEPANFSRNGASDDPGSSRRPTRIAPPSVVAVRARLFPRTPVREPGAEAAGPQRGGWPNVLIPNPRRAWRNPAARPLCHPAAASRRTRRW